MSEKVVPPRRDPRNGVIVLQSIVVAILLGLVLMDRLPSVGSITSTSPRGERVSVLDVVLDRESLRTLDIVFDRPLGAGKVGDVLGRDPALLTPATGGTWRWQVDTVLRFEPSARFTPATQYRIELVAERLLGPGQSLAGGSLTVKTDQFQVERVDLFEEPAPAGVPGVILRGDARFNYPVDPKVLATKLQILDPAARGTAPIRVDFETSYPSPVIGFRTEPIVKQKAQRELQLQIVSDLTPAEGNVPLAADYRQSIQVGSNEILTVRSYQAFPGDPESTIKLLFSSPIPAEGAGQRITIKPAVKYRLGADRNELVLSGTFKPGEEYEIALGEGLAGSDGSILKKDWSARIRIPDVDPDFDFGSQGMFLSATGYRNVAITSVNTDELELEVDRVYRNNLFPLFQYHGYDVFSESSYGFSGRRIGDVLAKETLKLDGARNKRSTTPLNLERFVRGTEPGIYRVALHRKDSYESRQRWLLLTDLGVVARFGDEDATIWVASFTDLSPVPGAQVRLISEQNQILAQGRTDAGGMWRARDLKGADAGKRPWMVTVERGDDFSFLLLERSGIDTAGFDVGGAARPKGGYEAFVHGERDIYRPGETARGVVVVRDKGLKTPPAMPVLLRHKDPDGQERGTTRLMTDARGMAQFSQDIPGYTRTGNHTLEVVVAEEVIGQYRFQVEEFIPDRIKVEITAGSPDISDGQPLKYQVAGAYLFGPPAANLPVESRVRLESIDFAPGKLSDFTFGNPERAFPPREVAQFTGQALDAAGNRTFEAALPAGLRPPAGLQAVITARVSEQGGRGVSAVQRLSLHPYAVYLGLRREGKEYAEPGRRVDLTWVAVTPAGEETKAGGLRASFYRDRWQTVLRRTPEGNFRYDSVRDTSLIETTPVAPGGTRGVISFTPREYGSYRAVIEDPISGASTQLEFYASGWGYSAWAMKDPGRIEMDLDAAEYENGQTATLQVRAPFPGRLFLTVERDRVYETQVHVMTGNTARITIPIRDEYRPNVFISAVLVRSVKDLEQGAAGRASGAVPLVVERASHRQRVTITAPDEVRPRTRLTVQVKTEPGSAVTLSAVDEGILQLIGQKTPDPFDWFYRRLRLGVRGYDIFAQLLPEVKPAPGGDAAMAGLAQFVRTDGIRRVEPVAFWSGVVETKSDGTSSVTFDLPDFQGALRIMAVSHLADRFGSSEKMTRVRSPLALLPTVPRVLSFSEKARLPVTVRNDTPREGEFEVRLRAEGPLRADGPSAIRVAIPRDAERTVYFGVATTEAQGDMGDAAEARITFTANGNDETATATTRVPVRPELPPITIESAGSLDQQEVVLPPADISRFRPGTARVELRISPVPLVRFFAKLSSLLHYPYGCVEQTTSSVFPLLYFGDLAREWDPETFRKSEPAAMVQAGIRRLGSMQIYSGGFGMWPGSQELQPWASIYATHFLVEARRAGHQVEPWLYDRALQFVAGEARTRTTYTSGELQRAAYALYVLARAGKADTGSMDYLREHQGAQLKGELRALVAAAYAAAGNPKGVSELMNGFEDAQLAARETGGNLNSTIRNRALLLMAMLDAQPGDARLPGLARRLAQDAESSGWWSTQETAFVFLSLGQLHRQQSTHATYQGTVRAGGRTVGTFGPNNTLIRGIPPREPIQVTMNAGYSPGAAFYAMQVRGVPTDASFTPSQSGLEVRRALMDRSGGALDASTIRQGDLIVVRTQVRSTSGRIDNVVVQNLLASGLEVENPRLKSTETLPWITDANLDPDFMDLRDDRVLLFTDLQDDTWRTFYTLLRAVTPGTFRLPPAQAEAMYDATVRATGERGSITVSTAEPAAAP